MQARVGLKMAGRWPEDTSLTTPDVLHQFREYLERMTMRRVTFALLKNDATSASLEKPTGGFQLPVDANK